MADVRIQKSEVVKTQSWIELSYRKLVWIWTLLNECWRLRK